MTRTATVRVRMEPRLKREAEEILRDCGLTPSEAIERFYRQTILERGLPFPARAPNESTRRVLRQSEAGSEVEHFDSEDALLRDLGF